MKNIKLTFKDTDGDAMTMALTSASIQSAMNELASKGWETDLIVSVEIVSAAV